MEMKGEYTIPAPRPLVWAALNDVDVLKAAIPGCDSINRLSETEIEATVTAKVGPVKASFKGLVTLSDIDPPNGYTIRGEGKGGAAGFARGGAKVRLADAPGGTLLSYEVDASVGGKLAQIGGRLIDSTAKKLADEFFAKFSALAANRVDMSPGTRAAGVTPAAVSDNLAPPRPQQEPSSMSHTTDHPVPPSKAKFDRWLLIVCVIAIVAGIYGALFVK
ncbi:MAG: carbon monoxide dehydrogenase subunit G [Rhodospirillaceae bacterium]|nr:carbon monoxide dehydrogenase subunit G [Rhodospirillaceae bacterium]